MPNSEIRPITYQLEQGKTLLIDSLLRIEYVNGEKVFDLGSTELE